MATRLMPCAEGTVAMLTLFTIVVVLGRASTAVRGSTFVGSPVGARRHAATSNVASLDGRLARGVVMRGRARPDRHIRTRSASAVPARSTSSVLA